MLERLGKLFKGGVSPLFIVIIITCTDQSATSNAEITLEYDSISVSNQGLNRYYKQVIYEVREDSILLFGYNHVSHAIDIFDLSMKQEVCHLILDKDGPNSIGSVFSIAVSEGGILVKHSYGISILNEDSIRTIPYREDILDTTFLNKKYQFGKTVTINRFSSLSVNANGSKVALPVYSLGYLYEGEEYDRSHLIGELDIINGSVDFYLPQYPNYYEGTNFYGDLDDLIVSYAGNRLVYSYRCYSGFWIQDLDNSSTNSAQSIPESLLSPPESINKHEYHGTKRKNYLANNSVFFEIRHDAETGVYYRTYKLRTTSNLINDYSENYLMRFDSKLNYEKSWKLDEIIVPDVFPMSTAIYAMCSSGNEDFLKFVRISIE